MITRLGVAVLLALLINTAPGVGAVGDDSEDEYREAVRVFEEETRQQTELAERQECDRLRLLEQELILAQAEPTQTRAEELYQRALNMEQHQVRRKQRKHLEQLRMLKLLELLDLRQDQELEFLTAFRSIRQEHKRLQQEKQEMINQLAQNLKEENVNERQLDEFVGRILVVEQMKLDVNAKFITDIRSVLDPEQVGKLIIFQERFEAELLDHVRAFRERKGQRSPRPMPEGR